MIKWDRPCYKCLSSFCDLSCKKPEHLNPPQRSFDYKEHAEGLQRDYDLLLAEYNDLKAQRTWVGLTDEDMQDVIQQAMHSITGGENTFTLSANKVWVAIVKEVEAKLKEKNNG